MASSRTSIAASRPVGILGRSLGQVALSWSTALALAALSSSSACVSVGLTTSEIRWIGQSVSSTAGLLQTSGGRGAAPRASLRRGGATPESISELKWTGDNGYSASEQVRITVE